MKQYGILLSLSFILTFLSGGLFLFVQKDYSTQVSEVSIEDIKESLKVENSIYLTLDADYPLRDVLESQLLDPKNILPKSFSYDLTELRSLISYEKSCNANQPLISRSDILSKAWQWQDYICGRLSELPKDFFKKSPYVHPQGGSFAYLAFKSKREIFQKPLWISENFKYFHVLEWKKLSPEVKQASGASAVIKVLMSLDINSALDFKERLPMILTKSFILLKNDIKTDKSIYSVFFIEKFQKVVKENNLKLNRYNSSFQCSFRDGNYCWEKDTSKSFKQFNMLILGVFLLVLIILITSIRALLRKMKSREYDRERKDFILKTISHEIRSPITATRLAVENIKQNFDDLPFKFQPLFLDISGQVSRLSSVVEKSKQYLSSDNNSILDLKLQRIYSMNEFLLSVLEPFTDKELVFNIENDFEFVSDPYWLSIVVQNLVANAFKHGRATVMLRCFKKENKCYIEVEDNGANKINKKIFDAFKKKDSSNGLGLGLYLCKKIVNAFSGSIMVKENPTTFIVCLKVLKV